MARAIDYVPVAEGDEALYLDKVLLNLSDKDAAKFANVYNARRKDPQVILITCMLGFLGIAGVHRFLLNQIGMGILYFFTAGLCLIGIIVDLINYKDLAFQYNMRVARDIKGML